MSISEEKHGISFQPTSSSPTTTKDPITSAVSTLDQVANPGRSNLNLNTKISSTPQDSKKYWWKWAVIIHHVLCLLWLAPAISLLALNLRQHIVGASIGCFSCRLNPFSTVTFQQEVKFNERDRNALGGMQLASKALEIWFMIVISGVLYDLLVIFSNGTNDFPLGLLARYVEFGDLLSLSYYPKATKKLQPWIFVVIVAILCVAVNLMGPATAILILPTLQWMNVDETSFGSFIGMASGNPPRSNTLTKNCSAEILAAGRYSCTDDPYVHSLDQVVASLAGSLGQIGQTVIIFDPVVSQEQQVSIIVNTTDAGMFCP
jgi:hypothetical protein